MQAKMNGWVQYVLLVAFILMASVYIYDMGSQESYPTAQEIATQINVPASQSVDLVNVTEAIANIQATLDEQDDFEDACRDYAIEEWEDDDFEDIYDAIVSLFDDIDDEDDIEDVIIKDTDITASDIDEETCTVVQDVKVYYEDTSGDDVKVYLTITSEIEEDDVDDQEIIETI